MITFSEFILYVKDQQKSKDFYSRVLALEPSLDTDGMTEFMLSENTKLGLMPEKGIAKILGGKTPHPETGNGIPRCELYLYVDDANEYFSRSLENGAGEISPVAGRSWGDTAGYVSDPDGHVIAFAQRAG
jgi:catechol 2,3-dioxygenase-like lactoylglutathione lyase family enzyme